MFLDMHKQSLVKHVGGVTNKPHRNSTCTEQRSRPQHCNCCFFDTGLRINTAGTADNSVDSNTFAKEMFTVRRCRCEAVSPSQTQKCDNGEEHLKPETGCVQ